MTAEKGGAIAIKTKKRMPIAPRIIPRITKNPNAINVKIAEQYTTAEHRPKAVVNATAPILRKFNPEYRVNVVRNRPAMRGGKVYA